MTQNIPQEILDGLTDVDMPRLPQQPGIDEFITLEGHQIPVHQCGVIVVGSGAAGLRAAVELKRRERDVTIVTQSAWGGTSACSGSDKQTLHTANTSDQGDDYSSMARAIRAGGAMHEDTAYVESVGSPRAMASLQFLGLPLPQDALGGTLRYQTDHDEVGRATSCGPRTSRLMVKVLAQETLRLDVPFFNHTTLAHILTKEEEDGRKAVGIVALQPAKQAPKNPMGLVLLGCSSLVLATGGPGELYRDSTFPNGCFGSLGAALEVGVELVNLTESQFGIGTRREGFPWNLSGTYVQSIPFIYSVDDQGLEHNFLADYFRTTQELASNIFRKGYQWPFHATRMLNYQSSLIDLAIYKETTAGRRVFMDFNRNPENVPSDLPFSLDRLDDDVSTYLQNVGANQKDPIARLRHMNPLAIELYRRYKVEITEAPLEFAVNNQHMNGGIDVDTWGRSNVGGIYAIGEAAGTHGVTRPGGAALIAGQVFGTRVAEHIAASTYIPVGTLADLESGMSRFFEKVGWLFQPDSPISYRTVRDEIQARMSDFAGIICFPSDVSSALENARALCEKLLLNGITYDRPAEMVRVLQWQQMATTSHAVLAALDHYIQGGGGSRGARAICDASGEGLPMARTEPLNDYRFRTETANAKSEQLIVKLEDGELKVSTRQNRVFDETNRSFFESAWPDWLTGRIYDLKTDGLVEY